MPSTKGPLWNYFIAGTKQNGSHVRAHCCGCIEKKKSWQQEKLWNLMKMGWVQEEQAHSDDSDDNDLENVTYRQRSKWLPRSLELLLGG